MSRLNTIWQGDCIASMAELEAGCVDLAFADPPFNIGYKYDVYDDAKEAAEYLNWSKEWMQAVHRVLKPTGTFWLAIGDEFAAELKILAQREVGFHCRSWVIWYYTFGVNCKYKFSRSHVHLFHLVKDRKKYTFNADSKALRVPSARQLVYADGRANEDGRLPDDTWILRPQDVPGGFEPIQDTWYYPRVNGTFKERAGFHGCQMPERVLARVIDACSNRDDLVLDPFSGSGTTLAVAKKLGRRYLGLELSEDYVAKGLARLKTINVGDEISGPENPLLSAPKTANGKRRRDKSTSDGTFEINSTPRQELSVPALGSKTEGASDVSDMAGLSAPGKRKTGNPELAVDKVRVGVLSAFKKAAQGASVDRLLCDPEASEAFLQACRLSGVPGDHEAWNRMLLRLRKSGELTGIETERTPRVQRSELWKYAFAAEIAWSNLSNVDVTLDDILCTPGLVKQFDELAADYGPPRSPFEYRWAALAIRKGRYQALKGLSQNWRPNFDAVVPLNSSSRPKSIPKCGLYLLKNGKDNLYIGETLDCVGCIEQFKKLIDSAAWRKHRVSPHLHFSEFDDLGKLLDMRRIRAVHLMHPILNLSLTVAS